MRCGLGAWRHTITETSRSRRCNFRSNASLPESNRKRPEAAPKSIGGHRTGTLGQPIAVELLPDTMCASVKRITPRPSSFLIGESMPTPKPAAVGLRAKTGRAIAVVAAGTRESVLAIHRAELMMSAPATPATFQPFHEVMDLPWEQAELAAQSTISAIEEMASRSLAALVRDLGSRGFAVCEAAVVGAPERKLGAIGNPHIRAHAAEGVLFRRSWKLPLKRTH